MGRQGDRGPKFCNSLISDLRTRLFNFTWGIHQPSKDVKGEREGKQEEALKYEMTHETYSRNRHLANALTACARTSRLPDSILVAQLLIKLARLAYVVPPETTGLSAALCGVPYCKRPKRKDVHLRKRSKIERKSANDDPASGSSCFPCFQLAAAFGGQVVGRGKRPANIVFVHLHVVKVLFESGPQKQWSQEK